MKTVISLIAFALACANAFALAQDVEIKASLAGPPAVGDNPLTITLTDAKGHRIANAKVTLTVGMTNMDMGTKHPDVENKKDGTYTATVNFSMAGPWRVAVLVEAPAHKPAKKYFDFKVKSSGSAEMTMQMLGRLGSWNMQKEGSGTAWLPESSPMFMAALPKSGRYDLNAMGFITMNTSDSGGKRGDSRFYSNSMLMLMARRETGGGTLGFSGMVSLDPVFNGEFGYPDLFQTGETAYGKPLTDYQHPHDYVAEAAMTYSHPIAEKTNAFVYLAPVGEPALGGPTFMHRPSGMEIPEAPISHHWFDSTHIAWGVATAGINSDQWQIEASAFNGKEPDENRYSPDPIRLNSASARLTFNPNKNLSMNTSYGYLKSPESKEPGIDQHRLTAALIYSQPLRNGDNLSATAAFGRNIVQGDNFDSILLEATYLTGPASVFARWEHVMKNELEGVSPGTYMINKFLLGGVWNLKKQNETELGVGAYAGFYIFPKSLEPFYGKSPVTLGVFLRLRPARMEHNH